MQVTVGDGSCCIGLNRIAVTPYVYIPFVPLPFLLFNIFVILCSVCHFDSSKLISDFIFCYVIQRFWSVYIATIIVTS